MKLYEYTDDNGNVGYKTADGQVVDTDAVLQLIELDKQIKQNLVKDEKLLVWINDLIKNAPNANN